MGLSFTVNIVPTYVCLVWYQFILIVIVLYILNIHCESRSQSFYEHIGICVRTYIHIHIFIKGRLFDLYKIESILPIIGSCSTSYRSK